MLLITLALKLATITVTQPTVITADRSWDCETYGPRLDNTYVTICNGRVTHTADKPPTKGIFWYLNPGSR